MSSSQVIEALPHLRNYEADHGTGGGGMSSGGLSGLSGLNTGGIQLERSVSASSTFTESDPDLLHPLASSIVAVNNVLGQRAAKMGWMQYDDVVSVTHMGYTRSRVFRAIQKSGRAMDQLDLNVMLDLCEREPETAAEDDSIEASYVMALQQLESGRSGKMKKELFNPMSSSMEKKNRRRIEGASGNSSQCVVELEAQVEEMRDDLATLLQCGISFELMEDPVVTPSGQLYERSKIEQWIHSNHTDPSSRKSLRRSQLISVRGLKDIADKYRGRGILECDA
jgi:hypothetical protein